MKSRIALLLALLCLCAAVSFGQSGNPTLNVSPPSPSTFGQTVTLSAGNMRSFDPVTFMDGQVTINSTTSSGSGTASFSTSALAVGSHSLQVCYTFDGPSTLTCSSFVPYTVNPPNVTTTTRLTFQPSTPVACQALTLIATVTASSGVPTGNVTFFDGTLQLGTSNLNTGGVASFTIGSVTPGFHQFLAQYNGGTGFNKSSDLQSPTIQSSVTMTVASSLNPSNSGQTVTFTATLTPASCGGTTTPATGQVRFFDGSSPLGNPVTISGGTAVLQTSALTVGSHSIDAQYLGDTNYAATTSSNSVTQVVNTPTKTTPTATVSANPNPATTAQGITLSVTVASTNGGAVPTGTVQFKDGSANLGGAVTLSGGGATLPITAGTLAAGTHQISATYNGDNNYNTANSNTVPLVISPPGKTNTSTAVSATPNPANTGQSVTITASVTPSAGGTGSPTGTVTFTDNGSPLPSGTLNGTTATITASFSTGGSHTIAASYSGDNNFNGSNGSTTLTVNQTQNPTQTVLQATPNPANAGQTVTLSATVTASTATGTVQFLDSGNLINTASVTNGTATLQTTFTAGTHTLTARYSGDSTNQGSLSNTVTLTVNTVKQSTQTNLSLNPSSPVNSGTPVSLVASVTPSSATGTIQFIDNGTPMGSVNLSGGSATLQFANPSPGNHSLQAVYSGDANFNGSTGNSTLLVNQPTNQPTQTSLVVTPTTANAGQTVTMTATVTPSTATGSVSFFDFGSQIASVALTNGTASFPTTTLTVGTHQLSAAYLGNNTFNASSSLPQQVTINGTQAAVSVVANPQTAPFGQSVTFNATVTGTGSTPTGTVTFNEGNTQLSTPQPLTNGQASFSTTQLSVGTHTIVASYSGNTTFGAASGTTTVTITKAPTTVSLSVTPPTPTPGQSVTLKATITPSTATGTVTFMDGTAPIGSPVPVVAGGTASTTATLTNGTHQLTAVYSGDASFQGSTSTPPTTVSLGLTATATTLTVSTATPTFGQSITLTATVTPSGATGTVTFLDGTASLGQGTLSNGTATLSTSALTGGPHPITAKYDGNSQFATSTSDPRTVTVAKLTPSVSLTATPSPATAGQSVTLRATVTPSTATGTVTFLDGTAAIGSPVTLSGGVATTTTSSLGAATHNLVANYSGDTNTNAGSGTASLLVNPSGTPLGNISPTALPNGIVGVQYSQTFTVTGGTGALTWTLVSGSVPGLSLSPGGVLSGTPTAAGTTTLGIRVTDSTGTAVATSPSLTVLPLPAPTVSSPTINTIADQPTPSVTIAGGFPVALTATFTLTFTSNASNLPSTFTNPDVKFSNGTTTSPSIAIPANSSGAVALPAVQVGSVAGTITVRLATLTTSTGQSVLPAGAVTGTITVPRGVPVITPGSVKITNITASGFNVVLQGTSTPRDLTSGTFTFTPASGATLNGASTTVNLSTAATTWFSDTGANRGVANGGKFALTVPFAYSGDVNALSIVSVILANSVGNSTAESGGK